LRGWTGYFAVGAGIVYVATTAAGSLLDPSYSQLRQPVSDLTATLAVTRAALVPPYVFYNVLCFAFAIGLYDVSDRSRLFKIGLGLLTINAVCGILMVTWFAEDAFGTTITPTGTGHIVLAGISSGAVVATALVHGVAFRRSARLRPLSRFSFAVGMGFVVLGPVAAAALATKSHLAGLAERGPIGLFIVWLLVVGAHALRPSRLS